MLIPGNKLLNFLKFYFYLHFSTKFHQEKKGHITHIFYIHFIAYFNKNTPSCILRLHHAQSQPRLSRCSKLCDLFAICTICFDIKVGACLNCNHHILLFKLPQMWPPASMNFEALTYSQFGPTQFFPILPQILIIQMGKLGVSQGDLHR